MTGSNSLCENLLFTCIYWIFAEYFFVQGKGIKKNGDFSD